MEVYHCCGLVNGALGTVIAIRSHTITVKFDGMSQTYPIERIKGRFVVMKNIPTTTTTVIATSSIMPQHIQVYSYLYEQRCNTVVHAYKTEPRLLMHA